MSIHTDTSDRQAFPIAFSDVRLRDRTLKFAVGHDRVDPVEQFFTEHGTVPESLLLRMFLDIVHPGDTVIDFGAHLGTFTVAAAALGAQVVAVEPGARNVLLLNASVQANGFRAVRVVNAVASDRSGSLAFSPHLAWGHVRKITIADDVASSDMPSVTGDDLVREAGWKTVDVIKLNTEGWELSILRGLRQTLAPMDAPAILLVGNAPALSWYGHTPEMMLEYLASFGYKIFALLHPADERRAVEWRTGDCQPEAIVEYLAFKRLPSSVARWRFETASDRLISERIARASQNPHAPYRRFTAAALATAPPRWSSLQATQAALQHLATDADRSVREAATREWARPILDHAETAGAVHVEGTPQFVSAHVTDTLKVEIAADDGATEVIDAPLTSDPPRKLALDLIRPGMKFIDLGAHIGSFALPAAAFGAEVLALEASPRNAELLQASVRRNGFKKFHVVSAAISDRPGWLSFAPCKAWGHVHKETVGEDLPSVETRAVTLDDLVESVGWERVDFIKVDVEGWERHALAGGKRVITSFRPVLLLEANGPALEWYGDTVQTLLNDVSSCGYTLFQIDRHDPGALVEWHPDTFPTEPIADYIAFAEHPEAIAGWVFKPALTREERIARIARWCEDPHPPYRGFFAAALRDAPVEVLEHPAIHAALRALRADSDSHVAESARWSKVLDAIVPVDYVRRHGPHVSKFRAFERANPGLAPPWRISPYTIRRKVAGVSLEMLIADGGAALWYDHDSPSGDLEWIAELGLIAPGDVVFDVGAHQGMYTLCFSEWVGPHGHVFAFEPIAWNWHLIGWNAELNGRSNITAIHAAVGEKPGSVTISPSTTAVLIDNSPGDVVTMVRLDDYADRKPQFIKIDAEGFESAVLSGATTVLATTPNLDLEIDERSAERYGVATEHTFALVDWSQYDCWAHTWANETGSHGFRQWNGRDPLEVRVATTVIARRKPQPGATR